MSAQEKSSSLYSTYNVQELVKHAQYQGIDFAYGDIGNELIAELQDGRIDRTKSVMYGCRIAVRGAAKFDLADFLDWLAKETIRMIEDGGGRMIRERYKSGRRFHLEYEQQECTGRVEIEGLLTSEEQLSLDVEIIESGRK